MLNLFISFEVLWYSHWLMWIVTFSLYALHAGYCFSNGKLKRQDETRCIRCRHHQRMSEQKKKKLKERTHVTCHSDMSTAKKKYMKEIQMSHVVSTPQTLITVSRRRPFLDRLRQHMLASHVYQRRSKRTSAAEFFLLFVCQMHFVLNENSDCGCIWMRFRKIVSIQFRKCDYDEWRAASTPPRYT